MVFLVLLSILPIIQFTFFAIENTFSNNFKLNLKIPKKLLGWLSLFIKNPIPILILLFFISDSFEKFGNIFSGIIFFGISAFLIWKKDIKFSKSPIKISIFLLSVTAGNFFAFLVWNYLYNNERDSVFSILSILFSYLFVLFVSSTIWISRKLSSLIIFQIENFSLKKEKFEKIVLILGIEKIESFKKETKKNFGEKISFSNFRNGKFEKFEKSKFLGIIVSSPEKFFFENNILPSLDAIVVLDSSKNFYETMFNAKRFLKPNGEFFINYDFDTKGVAEFCYLSNQTLSLISENNKKAHIYIKEILENKIIISKRLKNEEINFLKKIDDYGIFLTSYMMISFCEK